MDIVNIYKTKGLSDSSVKTYTRNIEKLYEKLTGTNTNTMKNLSWLKDSDKIVELLSEYKENTRRSYLIAIASLLKDLDKYEKIHKVYYDLLKNKNIELNEKASDKTEKQSDNWISWDDVVNKQKELEGKINKIKVINETNYDLVLQALVLSLYTLLPPRRNEYKDMKIVYKYDENLPKENYYSVSENKFYFNKYKTSKKYGLEVIDIPTELTKLLKKYIVFHPQIKGRIEKKGKTYDFLVNYQGEPLNKVNSITRILNRIFDKAISSSMLRNIYLTNKYKDVKSEMLKDAKAMGHSVMTQQGVYVKDSDDENTDVAVDKEKSS
jgi:hypothetical protein